MNGTPFTLVTRLGVDQVLGPQQQRRAGRGSSPGPAPSGSASAPRRGSCGNGLRWVRWAWATLRPRRSHPVDGAADGTPGRAPADRPGSRRRRRRPSTSTSGDVVGDVGDLGGPEVDHVLVVVRVVGDVAACRPPSRCRRCGARARACRGRPTVGPASRVAQVGPEHRVAVGVDVVGLGGERHADVGQSGRRRAAATARRRWPGSRRTAACTGVRYLRAMRAASMAASKQSDGLVGRHDRQRRLAVVAVHGQQQVGLLGLGGQAGRGTAALDVDDDAAAARG